jgi:predicted MFS family arabinose efflux permease
VIYPIVLYKLIPQIGFPWAVRTLGFIMLASFLIPNTVMKVRVLPAKKRPLVDISAFKQPSYMLFTIGGIIGFLGLYVPFFYVQYYAIQQHITDENLGFYLLSILNSASVFGRIIPNFLADKTGPLNMIIPCAAISGILALCLIPVKSVGGIVIFCVLYGFFSGAFVSLPPTILVHISPNRGLIGTRMGMCFSMVAVGVLVGTPIAGAILTSSGWTSVWVFGGVFIIAGALFMAAGRVAFKGWNPMTKA